MSTTTEASPVALAWSDRAAELTAWTFARLVNRTDRYGGYNASGPTTRPPKAIAGSLSDAVVRRHFSAFSTRDVIGLHSLGTDSRGLWCAVELDNHDDLAEVANRNLRYALHVYERLAGLGFRPLLATWGTGGYHVLTLFSEPVSGAVLHGFGRWLVADSPAFGFAKPPESFPKQVVVSAAGNAAWLRLIGRHHSREVWGMVWNGVEWLDGEAAVSHVLTLSGDSPGAIPAGVETVPAATKPPREAKPSSSGKASKKSASTERDVFAEYNATVTLDTVIGWHETKGHVVTFRGSNRVEFRRADKTGSGESFNVQMCEGTPITWNFSDKAGLPVGHGMNPVHVRCWYEHGSCDTPAMAKLAAVLKVEMGWPVPATPSFGGGKKTTEGESAPGGTTPWEIIRDFFRKHYKPVFRVGDSIHSVKEGREIRRLEACAALPPDLIGPLGLAENAPAFKGGGSVNVEMIPTFFKKWVGTGWAALLATLPDEDAADLPRDAVAADEFRRLVREAMLSMVTIGQDVVVGDGRDKHLESKIERQTVANWCQRFAKVGAWRGLRSYKCWFKYAAKDGGELVLRIAIRHELFSQLKADRRLCEMGSNKFSRRCTRYGIGAPGGMTDRPHGSWALILDDDFVADLTGSADVDDDDKFPSEEDV